MMKKIKFSEIKDFSDLPCYIKESSDKDIKFKTKSEVIREFNNDKWSKIDQVLTDNPEITLAKIDNQMESFSNPLTFFYEGNFYLATGKEVFEKHIKVIKEAIDPYLSDSNSIVELGAGYGSKILNLSNYNKYKNLNLFAAEYTLNGCRAIENISKKIGKSIQVGYCDLKKNKIDGIDIPKNSIIFTSYALHYVQNLHPSFIDFILDLKPRIVINFEPCYELHNNDEFGYMCKRYIELNDYNKNMISIFNDAQEKGKIELEIIENIIGGNPFLPISIIKWRSKNP